jgi:tRNA(Ile)-lysidine synthase
MRNAPPDTSIARFADCLTRLCPAPGLIGVAVSGGPDSVALLALAASAFPAQVRAATVDHGLRPESASEADQVAAICADLGVPHNILTPTEPVQGNTQAWARRVRYAALNGWANENGLIAYATAHHADDQLETMLMRINRGSGIAGLAGIRAKQGQVIRPLLGWRRAELAGIVSHCGLPAIDDPSNHDPKYDRARLRGQLAGAEWLDPATAARSAQALAEAEEALHWATAQAIATHRTANAAGFLIVTDGLPPELLRRVLIASVLEIGRAKDLRGDDVDRLIATLQNGKTATLAGVKCSGGATWWLQPAPPRRKN